MGLNEKTHELRYIESSEPESEDDESVYILEPGTRNKFKLDSGVRIRPTVDLFFKIHQLCRTGLIKALTTDIHKLRSSIQSFSDLDSDVCLHGLDNGNWELAPFPTKPFDHSVVGVILPKDNGITQDDWLSLVAERCDTWLLSLAISGSDGNLLEFLRQLLISMINDMPTIHQTVTNSLALTKWIALNETLEIAISNLGLKEKTLEQRINELNKVMPLNEASILIPQTIEKSPEQLFHLFLGYDKYEWAKCGEFGLILKPRTKRKFSPLSKDDGFRPRIRPTADIMFLCLQSRRTALIKALTTDIHQLQSAIQSFSDSDVCLHGLNDGNWKLDPFPTEPIEQALVGVILPKDNGIPQEDWLSLVAERCDAWLHSLAIFGSDGSLLEFQRQMLISMINDLPTIYETVTNPLALTKWMALNDIVEIAVSNLEVNEKTCEQRIDEGTKVMPLNEVAISNLPPDENPFFGNDEYEWAKLGEFGFILKLRTGPKSETGSEGVCGFGPRTRATMDILFTCLQSRRTALIKALTTDFNQLERAIQSFSNSDVCLHGLNDGTWKLAPFPIEPTEQALVGVLLPKDDGIMEEDWLSLVAERCDAWLYSLAIFGSDGHLTKFQMQMLFSMLDDGLPTVYETVSSSPLVLTDLFGLDPESRQDVRLAIQIRETLKLLFKRFQSRRKALIKALTTDIQRLKSAIESFSDSDVCLHGLSNGKWKVAPFSMELIGPAAVGVILPKDYEVTQEGWTYHVAVRCDAWLLSVAISESDRYRFVKKVVRRKLFRMMNEVPTIYATVIYESE